MKQAMYGVTLCHVWAAVCAIGFSSHAASPPVVHAETQDRLPEERTPSAVVIFASPTVIRINAVTANPGAIAGWPAEPFVTLSNHISNLEAVLRQHLDDMRTKVDLATDSQTLVLKTIREMRVEERQGYTELVSRLSGAESLFNAFSKDLGTVAAYMDEAAEDLCRTDAELAEEIGWLNVATACIALGFAALACVLLYRFRTPHQRQVSTGIVTAPVTTNESDATGSHAATRPGANVSLHTNAVQSQGVAIQDAGAVMLSLQTLAVEMGCTALRPLDETLAAVVTHTGYVRSDNQDYCLGFQIDGVTAELIADGCGGAAHGAYASYTAVKEAAHFVVRAICGSEQKDIVLLAREALLHASREMETIAASAEPPIREGFRTTLVIVLADDKRYAFAYAGDGGGVVVRRNGVIENFLFPQKADVDVHNVLATSLGPTLEGEPASGAFSRYAGDLLIIGTDGVWDYVGPHFPLAVAQSLAKADGNATAAAHAVLNDLADFKDDMGHVCSDNLTLGLLIDAVRMDIPPRDDSPASGQTNTNQ